MSVEKIDYAAIIADLEAKRLAIETAIASLRTVASFGTLTPADGATVNTTMPFAASGVGEVPDGAFHGKTMPDAIRLYLELMRKKQTAREISDGLRKGGMESTSKWFDKIVYATLDRLKKAKEVVKIGSEWGLPQWYPALMRAGISDNGTAQKAKAKKPVRKLKVAKLEEGPSSKIRLFLKENPGLHTPAEIKSISGIGDAKVAMMLLGQLAKKGEVEKTSDGKYRKI